LTCTLNGAKVLDFAARILNVDHNGLSTLALEGESGAHGVSLLPYFDGERTPNRPDATGVFLGLTTDTSREDIARATVERILCSMREAIRRIAPAIFGVDVLIPEPGEYVAMGAARQAAWALSGQALPPAWATQGTPKHYEAQPDTDTVARYEEPGIRWRGGRGEPNPSSTGVRIPTLPTYPHFFGFARHCFCTLFQPPRLTLLQRYFLSTLIATPPQTVSQW